MSQVILPSEFQRILTIAKAFITTVPDIDIILNGHYNIIFESKTVSELYLRWAPLFWNFLRNPNIPFDKKLKLFTYFSPCSKQPLQSNSGLTKMTDDQLMLSLNEVIKRNNRLRMDPIFYQKYIKERNAVEHFKSFLQLLKAHDNMRKDPVEIVVDPFYFAGVELKRKEEREELIQLILKEFQRANQNTLEQIFNSLKVSQTQWDVELNFDQYSVKDLKSLLYLFN
ncbi:hypothetical protein EHI8A_150760 [Entamoeba histolytica HM-1:IMSS-B]|uniref:Uncharacterized protein n=6 Tax=Entamoeba histolytica TaxID=5759 RepID=C4M9L4_ENTH1|nr:hypothetical protein EHI_022250 [Entamoeba histolytica HM-1:IMSS]EMD46435.1 Hypothetical protein EHI5A_179280 [Entamoeba histolytica KU27]EMH77964.1 hypothetical protein EHI8A_150760 [Entamoeba histolytica HM-1:IMSS-B]EMS12042.1 hypothetical protein KM1_234020 [Entamoeba histolytica HM-3:IMSS]ENY64001.1 hypothetical protein EHI7A_137410 [Entamoeba histolytica HM-1:IMSS-A]GAT98371.1 hypothetical protein CL6EHI_022250 [Entamoeba histolytica]|eukprot:XP_649855.1 hypothetical protein EHI_022250 [Entamoeba histolytica HM-1:IMSS]